MGVFRLENIERMLAQVAFLTLLCIIIWRETNLKIGLEQTCAYYCLWHFFFIITIVGFIQFYWLIHEQLLDNDDNIENNVIDFICMILYDDLTLIRCYLGICNIGGRYMTISNSMGLFSKHFFMGGLFQSHIIK